MEERRVDERGRGWVAFGSLDPREQERFKSQMNLPTLLMAPERKPRLSLRPSNLTGVSRTAENTRPQEGPCADVPSSFAHGAKRWKQPQCLNAVSRHVECLLVRERTAAPLHGPARTREISRRVVPSRVCGSPEPADPRTRKVARAEGGVQTGFQAEGTGVVVTA